MDNQLRAFLLVFLGSVQAGYGMEVLPSMESKCFLSGHDNGAEEQLKILKEAKSTLEAELKQMIDEERELDRTVASLETKRNNLNEMLIVAQGSYYLEDFTPSPDLGSTVMEWKEVDAAYHKRLEELAQIRNLYRKKNEDLSRIEVLIANFSDPSQPKN